MGFLDLSGALARRFGSVGLAIDGIGVNLTARPAATVSVQGPQSERARYCLERFAQGMQWSGGVDLQIEAAIPPHSGLGSGTQLALAVGVAMDRLRGGNIDVRQIATMHERGQRSGIGVGVFQQGGFVIDGGRGTQAVPPPVIARLDFPAAWRILLIFDHAAAGLHGERETEVFRAMAGWPQSVSAQLCHQLLMSTAPALVEGDLEAFGQGITTLQRTIGDHFASVQGGRYTSSMVQSVLEWLEDQRVRGVGQTSWGPTGFAFLGDDTQGQRLLAEAQARWRKYESLEFRLLRGRNQGAEVLVES